MVDSSTPSPQKHTGESRTSWEDRYPKLGLWIDLIMLSLVIINLSWIIFDSLFAFAGVQSMLATVLGQSLVDGYRDYVHAWFFMYDLAFVSVFITELLARWAYAIRQKTYSHWLVYPILHWYDVLGCIPIGELRWLRVLRVIAVVLRLQKMGVIDYRQWSIYQLFARWFNIVIEELSDLIAVKILEGVQQEIGSGDSLDKKVIERVVVPRKDLLVDVITQRVAKLIATVYEGSREDLESYIKTAVSQAMHRNPEIRTIEAIPMLGAAVSKIVHHTVNDIVCRSIGNAVEGMQSPAFRDIVADITDAVLADVRNAQQTGGDNEINAALVDLIEVIKDEVRIQRWKELPPETQEIGLASQT